MSNYSEENNSFTSQGIDPDDEPLAAVQQRLIAPTFESEIPANLIAAQHQEWDISASIPPQFTPFDHQIALDLPLRRMGIQNWKPQEMGPYESYTGRPITYNVNNGDLFLLMPKSANENTPRVLKVPLERHGMNTWQLNQLVLNSACRGMIGMNPYVHLQTMGSPSYTFYGFPQFAQQFAINIPRNRAVYQETRYHQQRVSKAFTNIGIQGNFSSQDAAKVNALLRPTDVRNWIPLELGQHEGYVVGRMMHINEANDLFIRLPNKSTQETSRVLRIPSTHHKMPRYVLQTLLAQSNINAIQGINPYIAINASINTLFPPIIIGSPQWDQLLHSHQQLGDRDSVLSTATSIGTVSPQSNDYKRTTQFETPSVLPTNEIDGISVSRATASVANNIPRKPGQVFAPSPLSQEIFNANWEDAAESLPQSPHILSAHTQREIDEQPLDNQSSASFSPGLPTTSDVYGTKLTGISKTANTIWNVAEKFGIGREPFSANDVTNITTLLNLNSADQWVQKHASHKTIIGKPLYRNDQGDIFLIAPTGAGKSRQRVIKIPHSKHDIPTEEFDRLIREKSQLPRGNSNQYITVHTSSPNPFRRSVKPTVK